MVYLTDNLVPDSLILPLKERDLIGTNQWNRLHDLPTHEKTAMLIDIVYRGHPELFDGFIEELMKDGQTAIAKRLTSKGNSGKEYFTKLVFLDVAYNLAVLIGC